MTYTLQINRYAEGLFRWRTVAVFKSPYMAIKAAQPTELGGYPLWYRILEGGKQVAEQVLSVSGTELLWECGGHFINAVYADKGRITAERLAAQHIAKDARQRGRRRAGPRAAVESRNTIARHLLYGETAQ